MSYGNRGTCGQGKWLVCVTMNDLILIPTTLPLSSSWLMLGGPGRRNDKSEQLSRHRLESNGKPRPNQYQSLLAANWSTASHVRLYAKPTILVGHELLWSYCHAAVVGALMSGCRTPPWPRPTHSSHCHLHLLDPPPPHHHHHHPSQRSPSRIHVIRFL